MLIYANLRAVTSTAFVCCTSEEPPAQRKKKKMQPREDSTAWVLVPGSVPARVLLLYGYFVRSERHFNVEVQLELQVRRESGRYPGSSSRKTEAKRWHRSVSGMNGLPPKRTQGKGGEDWGWGLAKERPVFQTGKGASAIQPAFTFSRIITTA